MTMNPRQRIDTIQARVRFYQDALAALRKNATDPRLISLIQATQQRVGEIEADPLLYASHGRRRPELLERWLSSTERRLKAIDADYKVLIEHLG